MKTPKRETISKVINNTATPDEARQVAQWFSTSEGEDFLTRQMEADFYSIHSNEADKLVEHPIPSTEMYAYVQKRIQEGRIKRWLFRAAVILIPLFLVIALYENLNTRIDLFAKAEFNEIYVPAGEQMQVVFQDGSRVFLNADSKLRYPKKFTLSERKIELEGEGFFEITTNRKRPFIVDIHAMQVKVRGTSFDVKAYPTEEHIIVSLEKGKIELTGDRFNSFAVQPGEKVTYDRKTGICKIIRPHDITQASAWKSKRLFFADTPISEVLATLSRAFNVTFSIADPAIMKYHCTLSTDMTSIEFVLQELEKIMPLRFQSEADNIVVTEK